MVDENNVEPEVIRPNDKLESDSKDNNTLVIADIAAQISQYTDRPDLLLQVLEEHDPGFIRAMNADSKKRAAELHDSRFMFGKVQAYSSLVTKVIAALICLFVFYLAVKNDLGFMTIIGIIVFYAISQGGLDTFVQIGKGIRKLIESFKRP